MTDAYEKARGAFNIYAGTPAPDLPDDPISALQVRLARKENEAFGARDDAHTALGVVARVADIVDLYFQERTRMLDLMLRLSMQAGTTAGLVEKMKAEVEALQGTHDAEGYRQQLAQAIAPVLVFLTSLCTSNRLDLGTLLREALGEAAQ